MVTIVLPISRKDYIKRIFTNLEMMNCDQNYTKLVVYIDGDMELFDMANNWVLQSKFVEKQCIFRRRGIPNVGSIHRRRQRIADIHNELKEMPTVKNSDYVFMVEDDTIFHSSTLEKLLRLYSTYPYAGFVSGVQIGRWGYTHIGAWQFDDPYEPKIIKSTPLGNGLSEVDAAGFFCCLTKTTYYTKHTFKPYDVILGPDVDYGIALRKQGLKNYIDYSITCSHLTKHGEIKFLDTDIQQVQFEKQSDVDVWIMTTINEGV